MRQKGLKNSSKSQQGSLNSAEVWMTPGSLPLPSRLSQTIWWPEMLSGPFLTSASYLDVSPCGTLAHTCKKNLWNTLDSDKRRPPSYPLHLTDHPRRPSETGKKDSLDWILSNQPNMQSIQSPPLKNKAAGFTCNSAAGDQKWLISGTARGWEAHVRTRTTEKEAQQEMKRAAKSRIYQF